MIALLSISRLACILASLSFTMEEIPTVDSSSAFFCTSSARYGYTEVDIVSCGLRSSLVRVVNLVMMHGEAHAAAFTQGSS